jgi:hypothetical protein
MHGSVGGHEPNSTNFCAAERGQEFAGLNSHGARVYRRHSETRGPVPPSGSAGAAATCSRAPWLQVPASEGDPCVPLDKIHERLPIIDGDSFCLLQHFISERRRRSTIPMTNTASMICGRWAMEAASWAGLVPCQEILH